MEASQMIRVLIADDQETDAAGIRALLENIRGIAVVGEELTAAAVVQTAYNLKPDVILVDLMWRGNEHAGARIIKDLKTTLPTVKVVALTNYSHLIDEALQSGADEAMTKTYTRRELVATIGAVCNMQGILASNVEIHSNELSDRELEILKLVATGNTDKGIGAQLGVSSNTVKHHLANVYIKLKVASRAEAVKRGYEMGFLR